MILQRDKTSEVRQVCGFEMDYRIARDQNPEVDLESGLAVDGADSKKNSPGNSKQGKSLFAKVSGMFCDYVLGDDGSSLYWNESNTRGLSDADMEKVTCKSPAGRDSVGCAMQSPAKENRKKSSNKKAPKPPRPPRAPSLDAADLKLIREISELAMLKRARIERMQALKKKMKTTKSSSLSNSGIFSMVFTIVFCVVIIFQGISSGQTSELGFQGSPVSTALIEGGMISVHSHLNPSASIPSVPGSESSNFVQRIANSYSSSPDKQRKYLAG